MHLYYYKFYNFKKNKKINFLTQNIFSFYNTVFIIKVINKYCFIKKCELDNYFRKGYFTRAFTVIVFLYK